MAPRRRRCLAGNRYRGGRVEDALRHVRAEGARLALDGVNDDGSALAEMHPGGRKSVGASSADVDSQSVEVGVSGGMSCDVTCRMMALEARVAPAGQRRKCSL
jgi:hypothetical protein